MTGQAPLDAAPGIYHLICASIEAQPDQPLDTSGFPAIKPGDDVATKLVYSPGLLDGIAGRDDSVSAEEVRHVFTAFAAGEIDLGALEAFLQSARAIALIDEVLPPMLRDGSAEDLIEPLWTLACSSVQYEAIKWGIAIGSRSAEDLDGRVDALLMFARHPEFTLFATNALLWHSRDRRDIPLRLARLLSFLGMWGRYHLLNQMGRRRSLFDSPEVQREIVVRAGKRTDDGRGERSLGELVDLACLMDAADGDAPLIDGLMGTMDGLLQGAASSPFDIDDTQGLLTSYANLLERCPRSTRRLDAIAQLDRYLHRVTTSEWHRQHHEIDALVPLADRVSTLIDALADRAILEEMLGDPDLQRRACRIIDQYAKSDLAPALDELMTPAIDDEGMCVRTWVIEAYVSITGERGRSALARVAPVFDLPLPHSDDRSDWRPRYARQERLCTLASWSLAMMEVGTADEIGIGAQALVSPSLRVRMDLYRRLRHSPIYGSQLLEDAVVAAFDRLRSADRCPGTWDGEIALVTEFGDAAMHDWLFDNLERVLPAGRPDKLCSFDDRRFQLHRTALDLARKSSSPAAQAFLDRARIGDYERIREYMADDDRRQARKGHA